MTAPADPKKTHVVHQWKYSRPLISCRFTPDGKYVFASSEDNSIQRFEVSTGKRVAYVGHESWVRSFEFSGDGKTVISGACDDQIIFWPVEGDKPKAIKKLKAHDGWVRALAVDSKKKLLASGGNDNLVKVWDLSSTKLLHTFEGHTKDVYSAQFHPKENILLTGDLAGKVRQWEIGSGKFVREFDAKKLHTYNGGQQVDYGGVRSIAFSKDLKQIACAGLYKATNPLGAVSEPIVLRFDWASQKLLKSHVFSGVKGIAWRTIFHPEGFLLGASGGSGGGYLGFWKADADKEFHKFKLPNLLREMDLHPDGIQIATTHADSHLRISKMTAKVEKKKK